MDRIQYLYGRCISGTATPEERLELAAFLSVAENEAAARELLHRAFLEEKELEDVAPATSNAILQAIYAAGADTVIRPVPLYRRTTFRWLAAAVFIGMMATTAALLWKPNKPAQPPATANTKDVPPGTNKAILTLSDGRGMVLDSAGNGVLVKEGSISVVKTADGQLAYQPSNNNSSEVLYNTLSTPRGGQHTLVLSDGTKVWLNAASSITYPIVFTGNERKVRVTGEAYFEVKHDAAHPFTVAYGDNTIKDLGTGFNVMDYTDELQSEATLVEGSIAVSKGPATPVVIQPGHMAIIKQQGNITIKKADVEQVTAWKNGQINFSNASLETVLRQVSRWYDVNIYYEGKVPDKRFFGLLDRNVYLSTILEFLQQNGVHIKQEGRDLTVTNN